MRTLKQLAHLFERRDRLRAVALLALMLLGAVLEMLGVGAIPAFVSVLSDPEAALRHDVVRRIASSLGVDDAERLVLLGAGALLALFVVKNGYLAVLTWLRARYIFGQQVRIARRLLSAYLHAPYAFHLRRNTAELLRNTNQEAMEIVGQGLMPVLTLIMEGMTVAAILVLLLTVDPATSIAAFAILGGTTVVFLRLVRGRAVEYGELMHDGRRRMIQAVNEGLGGIKVTRVLGREDAFANAFAAAATDYSKAGRVRQVLFETPRLLLETVAVAGILGAATLMLAQGRSQQALIPGLTLLAVAVLRMIPSFNRITSSLNQLRYARAAVEAVVGDLRTLEGLERATGSADPIRLREAISLENVSLTYDGASTPSLRDVSLRIQRNRVVGVSGRTGAGKTTLVDVIIGLLPPTSGAVLVDGEPLRGREIDWQSQIGYVPQDVFLADDTVRHNVAFGLSACEIDDSSVWRALAAAQAREFVEELAAGLDTVIGERGVRLSGGQRQRLGIARALYDDPSVLVLDEATSSLDDETERAILEAIEAIRGSRTIIVIAHRQSTLEVCDTWVHIEGGCAVEGGASPGFGRRPAAHA